MKAIWLSCLKCSTNNASYLRFMNNSLYDALAEVKTMTCNIVGWTRPYHDRPWNSLAETVYIPVSNGVNSALDSFFCSWSRTRTTRGQSQSPRGRNYRNLVRPNERPTSNTEHRTFGPLLLAERAEKLNSIS